MYTKPSGRNEPVPITQAPRPEVPVPPGNPPPPQSYPNSWMTIPQNIPNCPSGLEYLSQLEQLLVRQEIDLAKLFHNFESNYEFTILNRNGQYIYRAIEDNDFLTRNHYGPIRPFNMKVLDVYQHEIIHFYRPLRCHLCCFPCCLQLIEVSSHGEFCGSVEQEWSLCLPNFRIKNHLGESVLRIEGPLCTSSCYGTVDFKVVSLDGVEVGSISKQWAGHFREMYTTSDFFGITFPVDLDVRMKAVMLGACMLINCMYYEEVNTDKNQHENHDSHSTHGSHQAQRPHSTHASNLHQAHGSHQSQRSHPTHAPDLHQAQGLTGCTNLRGHM